MSLHATKEKFEAWASLGVLISYGFPNTCKNKCLLVRLSSFSAGRD